jgi:uncharacterized delta-60 repeat protein
VPEPPDDSRTGGTTGATTGNQVELLPGEGNGQFGTPKLFPLAAFPTSLVAADFNQDGHLDLAIGEANGTVQVLPGDHGGLDPAVTVATLPSNDAITQLVSGNLTGEGNPDLFATGEETGDIYGIADSIPPISAPDPTFGTAGTVTLSFTASAVNSDTLGQPLCAGSTTSANGDYSDFVLVRYSTSGVKEFKTLADFGEDAHATGVTEEPDGKILEVGFVTDKNGHQHVAAAQFDSNGSLDTTFGNNGTEIGPVVTVNGGSLAFTPAVQPDGKILIADGLGPTFRSPATTPT